MGIMFAIFFHFKLTEAVYKFSLNYFLTMHFLTKYFVILLPVHVSFINVFFVKLDLDCTAKKITEEFNMNHCASAKKCVVGNCIVKK